MRRPWGGSDLPNWLELSRAGTIQVDRKTGYRPTLFIQHAAVSITGTIQPGAVARALKAENMEVGLGARILMAMPPKKKRWSEEEIHPEVREAFEKTLAALRGLQLYQNNAGEKEPFAVRLTPEAKDAWVRFYGEWANVQADVEGELAAAYSKLEGYTARLALLHHVVTRVHDRTDCDPVEAASIEAGVVLVRWFAYETRRIYAALSESEDARHTRRLMEFIRAHGGKMRARRLHLSNRSRYPDAEAAEVALGEVVEAGLAEWADSAAGPRGGRPTRTLILKPDTTYYKTYEPPQDDDEDDGPDKGPVTTDPPTKPPPPGGNPAESEGFVVSEACSTTVKNSRNGHTAPAPGRKPAGGEEGVLEHGLEGKAAPAPCRNRNASLDATCFKSYETPGDGFLLESLHDKGSIAYDSCTKLVRPLRTRVP